MKLLDLVLVSGFKSPLPLSGSLRDRLDLAAQSIDPSDHAQNDPLAVAVSKVVGAQVFVVDAVFEHVVGRGEGAGCLLRGSAAVAPNLSVGE